MTSIALANHVLNFIVDQSKQKIHQHKLVKKMMSPFSASNFSHIKGDLIYQAGTQNQRSNAKSLKKQQISQEKPIPNMKDTNSFFSVKKYKPQGNENSVLNSQEQPKNPKINNLFSKRHSNKIKSCSFDLTQVALTKKSSRKGAQQSSLIKIQVQKQQLSRWQKKQQFLLQQQRDLKAHRDNQACQQNLALTSQRQKTFQRQQKLSSYLQTHISKPSNTFTYDLSGQVMLLSSELKYKTQFPPTMRYEVQDNQLVSLRQRKRGYRAKGKRQQHENITNNQGDNQCVRGARGEIFKSAVVRTVNLSRLSLGGGNHQDQMVFMKRNDLFNNNHCRQTTSIPYLKPEQGTTFRQVSTNAYISNKNDQTQQNSVFQSESLQKRPYSQSSHMRSEFKKYSLGHKSFRKSSTSFIQAKPQSNRETHYEQYQSKRPHTMEVGRIRRANQSLVMEMLG